jgi:hypothetical protein
MTITGVGGGASSVAADTVNGRVSRELWKIVSSPRTVNGPVDNSATARLVQTSLALQGAAHVPTRAPPPTPRDVADPSRRVVSAGRAA